MNKTQGKKLMTVLLATGLFLSLTVNAMAASADVTGTGGTESSGGQYKGTVNGELTNRTTEIDIQAITSGGSEIVYDLDVAWGAMQFEYDYGSTWNPATHSYTTGNSGRQQGGWVMSYVDGVNNKITVTNNSNFPMKADFSYANGGTSLNANPGAQGSVTGVFAYATADLTQAELDKGVLGPYSSGVSTSASLTMEMDASNILTGGYYYWAADNTGATNGSTTAIEKSVYFSRAAIFSTTF